MHTFSIFKTLTFENRVDPDQPKSDDIHYTNANTSRNRLKIGSSYSVTFTVRLCGHCAFCLFDLILYVPVNNFSVMSGPVSLG